MKKNILTTVATATLFTGLALSSAAAGVTAGKSILCFDGDSNKTSVDQNISIDLKNQGKDVNLTLIPAAVYQGVAFTIEFENGGLSHEETHLLCVGDTKVGGLQEPGELSNNLMVKPIFSFIDNDDVADLIAKDSNITFVTSENCDNSKLHIIGSSTEACKSVTAKITKGRSTQGDDVPSIITEEGEEVTFGKTVQYIKISCKAPECFVTQDAMKFTENEAIPGVNVPLSEIKASAPNHFIDEASCPSCDKKTLELVNSTPCVTYITIKNDAPIGEDLNITGLDIVTSFVPNDGEPATFTPSIKMFIGDDNTTDPAVDVILGNKLSPNDLHIAPQETAVIKVALVSDDDKKISLGSLKATIDGIDTNKTQNAGNLTLNPTLVDIKKGASTDFTVPYMSRSSASKVNFVRISTLIGATPTTLSAVISDEKGNTCPVTYDNGVPGNGGSVQIFASKVPAKGNNIPLIPEGECPNLETDFFSVKFSAGASVNAVSFMRTKAGERTLKVF